MPEKRVPLKQALQREIERQREGDRKNKRHKKTWPVASRYSERNTDTLVCLPKVATQRSTKRLETKASCSNSVRESLYKRLLMSSRRLVPSCRVVNKMPKQAQWPDNCFLHLADDRINKPWDNSKNDQRLAQKHSRNIRSSSFSTVIMHRPTTPSLCVHLASREQGARGTR